MYDGCRVSFALDHGGRFDGVLCVLGRLAQLSVQGRVLESESGKLSLEAFVVMLKTLGLFLSRPSCTVDQEDMEDFSWTLAEERKARCRSPTKWNKHTQHLLGKDRKEAGHDVGYSPQEAADAIDVVDRNVGAVGEAEDFFGQAVEGGVLRQLGELPRGFTGFLGLASLLARRGGRGGRRAGGARRSLFLLCGGGIVDRLVVGRAFFTVAAELQDTTGTLEFVLELGLETGRDRGLGRAGCAGPRGAAVRDATGEDGQETLGLLPLDRSDSGERTVGGVVGVYQREDAGHVDVHRLVEPFGRDHVVAALAARQQVFVQEA
ncbi:hypothetical protein PG991_015847 [Apiospora marii]|uniref:Uncharacterized protein n=1 Tax=Apiospora marii TaxID=335849 RepID=A0ABR1R0H1_9PEZI